MLQERQVTSYLILRRNSLNTYLKNFDIAHDTFSYDITYSDIDLLETYHDEKKSYADTLTIEGEFTGNSYDNFDIMKSKIAKLKKQKIRRTNQ